MLFVQEACVHTDHDVAHTGGLFPAAERRMEITIIMFCYCNSVVHLYVLVCTLTLYVCACVVIDSACICEDSAYVSFHL